MRVRVIKAFATPHPEKPWNVVHDPGEELSLPDARGIEYIAAGLVERIATAPETATLPKRGEQAVRQARPVQ